MSGTKSKLMRWVLLLADFDYEVYHVSGSHNQAADSLLRHPVETEREGKEIPEREISAKALDKSGEFVLMTLADLEIETIRNYQEEDLTCKRMKEWILKSTTDFKGVPRNFKRCYKGFRIEDGNLKYASHLTQTSAVRVVPRGRSREIMDR